jgi:peptidoglycan/LPS O-acetylase OafA/YrhL
VGHVNGYSPILQRRKIPGLDGIRGIAALMVVFHGWPGRFQGGLAVEVSFVISGLLITWLLLQEQQRSGTID